MIQFPEKQEFLSWSPIAGCSLEAYVTGQSVKAANWLFNHLICMRSLNHCGRGLYRIYSKDLLFVVKLLCDLYYRQKPTKGIFGFERFFRFMRKPNSQLHTVMLARCCLRCLRLKTCILCSTHILANTQSSTTPAII